MESSWDYKKKYISQSVTQHQHQSPAGLCYCKTNQWIDLTTRERLEEYDYLQGTATNLKKWELGLRKIERAAKKLGVEYIGGYKEFEITRR